LWIRPGSLTFFSWVPVVVVVKAQPRAAEEVAARVNY